MIMRASTRTAVATTAFLSGRAGAFLSSGGLWRHEGISRANTARCLSMEAEREKVGFIGLGIMGTGMASNLIKGGRDVIVWNRTASKAADFSKRTGCETAATPKEVVEQCFITYSMLSTPEAASEVFFDPHDGVLAGLSKGKCLVDCATLQVEDMQDMYSETIGRGAKFLEAPVSGSKGARGGGGSWCSMRRGRGPLREGLRGPRPHGQGEPLPRSRGEGHRDEAGGEHDHVHDAGVRRGGDVPRRLSGPEQRLPDRDPRAGRHGQPDGRPQGTPDGKEGLLVELPPQARAEGHAFRPGPWRQGGRRKPSGGGRS
ncbi:unnamed protein product [Ectocarpus sp. 6 AP-2014]